jgi:RimJ/RimL family protein N-acetyltransferase
MTPDPAVRLPTEADIPRIRELFRLNYPVHYPHPELYNEDWLRMVLGSDEAILRVIDEGEVVAFGVVFLDYGDYDNRVGLLGGVVAHPERANAGIERGLGWLGARIIKTLACEAGGAAECLLSEARTRHRLSQRFLKGAGLKAVGLLPHYNLINEQYETLVLYARLYDEGRRRRAVEAPRVIEEVAPLARQVLAALELPAEVEVVEDCPPYSGELPGELRTETSHSPARLRAFAGERPGGPAVFDSVAWDYGLPYLSGERISYQTTTHGERVVGGVGYRVDSVNQLFKVTDLVFAEEGIADYLCGAAVALAREQGARIIEADVSAYDARMQRTFLARGFLPVAYVPAMALHDNRRLDAVKMLRLETTYTSLEERLEREVAEVAGLVEDVLARRRLAPPDSSDDR